MLEDEKIIDLFFARSDQAIAELDAKYGKLCRNLSLNILNDERDAEECVSDAYLAAWNAIPPAKPKPLRAYICKIVRIISIKRYYKNGAARRNGAYDAALEELEDRLSAPDTVESEIESKELSRVIEDFLGTLSIENRVIFMRRYAYVDTYADIAARVGLSEKNVSVRLVRMREKLKKYLAERGLAI